MTRTIPTFTRPAAPRRPARFGARRIYRDAGSMVSSSAANVVLGIAFWALAARIFPPEQLGVMTAVLAVMMSAGLVIAAGVGDAYGATLPAAGPDRIHLYRRGQRIFLVLAVIGGLAAALGTTTMLPEAHRSSAVGVLAGTGVLAWAALNLQGSTLVALGRARWLPAVNIATSIGRIALLPLLVLTFQWHAVELSFIVSTIVAVIILRPAVARAVGDTDDLPPASMTDARAGRTFNAFVAQTVSCAALNLGLLTLTPFLVTAFAGPSQGALFALALSIVQALDLVVTSLTASLVVHASSVPEQAATMARAVLTRTLALVIAGAVAVAAVAPAALSLLDREYGAMGATGVVAVLCVACVLRAVFTVWAGLQRARRNIKAPLMFYIVSGAVLMLLMPGLCGAHGALGGAYAILLSQAVLTVAAVVHVLVGWRRERRTATHVSRGRY